MNVTLTLLYSVFLTPPAAPETRFAQVAPLQREWAPFERTGGQSRAIVLIHGLRLSPFSTRSVTLAQFSDWQEPDSSLVRALEKEGDVYAFAYSQDVPLDRVVTAPGLRESVRRLRELGYQEVVLVGHSAGGVVARHFVEDYPDAGVTKVVQVSSPNGGSGWARARVAVRAVQEAFLTSLSHDERQQCLQDREDRRIPDSVEFVCVVCRLSLPLPGSLREIKGDGVISASGQWTPDLQNQGIPAVLYTGGHTSAMSSREGVALMAQLVRERQPRWDADGLAAGRARLLSNGRALR
ncbi:MAG: alpha/beta fold hydrolase [Gemmataceae bacterium]|nr:alpha/beta fold hydrolase [Gemmataceae bacterium]